jgi:hypothetical protein
LAGETKVLGEKTCPSASLFTTNPTWPDLGSNLGHCGGKAATNRLKYGTALDTHFIMPAALIPHFLNNITA